MHDIPETQAREDALRAMLRGESEEATRNEAEAAVKAAHANREGPLGQRTFGFGLIKADPLYERGDGQDLLFALTDGERQAAFPVRVSGTRAAMIENEGGDLIEHAIERMRGAADSIPRDGERYESFLLSANPYPID